LGLLALVVPAVVAPVELLHEHPDGSSRDGELPARQGTPARADGRWRLAPRVRARL